jgi:hypothetical protein
MSFIHQQIQSFLNLGACKEYPIMAKPKFPKKSNGAKEYPSSIITPPAAPELSVTAQAASAAASGTETAVVETRAVETRAVETRVETKKTQPKKAKAAKKPEIVKADPRANLVPINLEDEIRRLAYLFSERRGFEAGHEAEDWINAEREIRQRYHQHSA